MFVSLLQRSFILSILTNLVSKKTFGCISEVAILSIKGIKPEILVEGVSQLHQSQWSNWFLFYWLWKNKWQSSPWQHLYLVYNKLEEMPLSILFSLVIILPACHIIDIITVTINNDLFTTTNSYHFTIKKLHHIVMQVNECQQNKIE